MNLLNPGSIEWVLQKDESFFPNRNILLFPHLPQQRHNRRKQLAEEDAENAKKEGGKANVKGLSRNRIDQILRGPGKSSNKNYDPAKADKGKAGKEADKKRLDKVAAKGGPQAPLQFWEKMILLALS
jgi:hypothetical protein